MDDIKITKLLPEHAPDAAKLHISGIPTGFISSLGIDFVTFLYEAIAESPSAFGFVAEKENKVAGFIAFTTNVGQLYKSILRKHGLGFIFILIQKIFYLRTMRNAIETLFYPHRLRKMSLPSSELLSIVIVPGVRKKGLAKSLVLSGLGECEKRGIDQVKVLVGAANKPANQLYLKCGFQFVTQINNHGVISNIFAGQTTTDNEKIIGQSLDKSGVIAGNLPVFVTYGWCRSSYAAVLSLGQRGINVHVGDASNLAMSRFSRHCKSFTKLPEFFLEPEAYFKAVCDALKKTGAKVLLPGHEDVGIFAKCKDDLPPDVRLVIPDKEAYDLAEDKYAILELARKTGCPTPTTFEITEISGLEPLADSLDWPVVIKTRIGNSAKGVRIAHNEQELFVKFTELIDTYKLKKERWPIIQEFLPGEAAGVCLLYDHSKCITTFAEKYLYCKEPAKFGTSILRQPYDNPDLIAQAVAVMDRLNWHGMAHLDFIADKDGVFKLIEVNPRLWGALALSFYAGVDFSYLWYLTALGEDIPQQNTTYRNDIKCRWIAGECLAMVDRLKRREIKEMLNIMARHKNCYHDDFLFRDPLPLMFEVFDYFVKFVKAGGSINPVTQNMIR